MSLWKFALLFTLGTAGCTAGEVGVGTDTAASDALRSCAGGSKVAGIDVSYYQGTINWAKVADPSHGDKSFAYIRATDGLTHDTKFAANWAGAFSAGMYRGAYAFFRASDDPTTQAEALLNSIGWEIGEQDLPPVIDLEVKDGMSSATVASRAKTFLDYVYTALGRRPIVYTGSGFEAEIGNPSSLAAYPLWVANWTTSCPSMPTRWTSWDFWQNSSVGTVSGISTHVDLDFFDGDANALAAYAGPSGK